MALVIFPHLCDNHQRLPPRSPPPPFLRVETCELRPESSTPEVRPQRLERQRQVATGIEAESSGGEALLRLERRSRTYALGLRS
jgi:hypothetical protein